MKSRHMSRIYALQVIYGQEGMAAYKQGPLDQEIDKHFENFEVPQESREMSKSLILAVFENLISIDKEIESKSANWRVSRMGAMDRCIIRMALAEIRMGATEVPIVINEAVELAKEFGDKNSPAFVNGLIDGLVKSG